MLIMIPTSDEIISTSADSKRDVEVGSVTWGVVSNVVPFGAFVDIRVGKDALLHRSEIPRQHQQQPEDILEILHVGEKIRVRVISVDHKSGKIGLSLKGLKG